MKWFALLLSYIIFLTLITNSAQSTAVDDSGGNEMVSEDVDKLNAVPTKDSKYKIYLNTVVRNTQGELISVAEGSWCKLFEIDCSVHMHPEITDYAFDTLLGEKEIITIDNIMYEKVQFSTWSEYTWLFDTSDRKQVGVWEFYDHTSFANTAFVEVCGEVMLQSTGYECNKIFYSRVSFVYFESGDVATTNWTILRDLN
jgi:hypothetical protein